MLFETWFKLLRVLLVFVVLFDFSNNIFCSSYDYKNFVRGIEFVDLLKFISFQTLDDDMKVQLKFQVPFVSLEQEKKKNADNKGFVIPRKANFNIAAAVLTGIVTLSAASLSLALTTAGKMIISAYLTRSSRDIDCSNDVSACNDDPYWTFVQKSGLATHHYEDKVKPCFQMIICLRLQMANENIHMKWATPTDKVIDGLASMNSVLDYFRNSTIGEAVLTAKADNSCIERYKYCILGSKTIVHMLYYL